MNRRVYFAHPFDTWQTPEEAEIEGALRHRGFDVVNPFDKERDLCRKFGADNYYDAPTPEFASAIVEADFELFDSCDAYFGWFPGGVAVVGTAVELAWAVALGKRVLALSHRPNPFLVHYSNEFYLDVESLREGRPTFESVVAPALTVGKDSNLDRVQVNSE